MLLGTITILRLEQILSAKDNLDSYPSLRHFRNASSHRITFDDASAEIVIAISNSLNDQSSSNDERSSAELAQPGRVRVTRSMRVRDMQWVRFTGDSPTRKVQAFYANEAVNSERHHIIERRKWCPGNAVYCVSFDEKEKMIVKKGEGTRNSCALCSKTTQVWCTICHTWLCGPHVERQFEETDCVIRLSAAKKIFCLNTCWILWHQEGLDRIHGESVDVVTYEE